MKKDCRHNQKGLIWIDSQFVKSALAKDCSFDHDRLNWNNNVRQHETDPNIHIITFNFDLNRKWLISCLLSNTSLLDRKSQELIPPPKIDITIIKTAAILCYVFSFLLKVELYLIM